jgi:hypothetical protein
MINRLSIFALLAAFAFGGCVTARIPVPRTLLEAHRFPVEGRNGWRLNEDFRFGPFEISDVRRSWTRGSDLEVQVYEGSKRVQQYRFELVDEDDEQWDVSCGAFLRMRAADFEVLEVEFENRAELDCTIAPAEDPDDAWTLSLRGESETSFEGTLSDGDEDLHVMGINELENALSSGSITGYEIHDEGAVAAVEVINDGTVWLDSASTDERRAVLAATVASLLLYEDLRAHVAE